VQDEARKGGRGREESNHTYLFAMMEALHVVVTDIHALLEIRSCRLKVMVTMI
jgi:hypothetical protein